MGLKDMLVKLKLVEVEGHSPAGGAAGDSPELAELLARVPPPPPVDERRLAASRAGAAPTLQSAPRTATAAPGARTTPAPAAGTPAAAPASSVGDDGELPGFEEIYRAAGIVDPAHGFTAFKVLEFLASPELAQLEGRARAATLATFLRMNPAGAVSIADVLEDAVRRDQALDQFEQFLRSKLSQRADGADREIARLEAELAETQKRLRAAIEAERSQLDAATVEFERWRATKRTEEQRLFDAVAPFVEANPITREGA